MAIKQTVTCDISGKEIKAEDFNKISICQITYKKLGKQKHYNSNEEFECVTELQEYQLHIAPDKANKFMEGLQNLLKELKEN